MSARLFLVMILSLLLQSPAHADTVADLYAANVPVSDQSAGVRAAALREALGQVLVKITGTQGVMETSAANELLQNPSRYLQQYRYESIRPVPADPDMPRLALRAEFDGGALERRLRSAGLPLWGRERPMTLVWLALSDGNRELIGAKSSNTVVDALQRAAVRRGLPLELPVLDTEDVTRVSFMDVWGVYEEPLLAAAERYSPDAIMSGSIFSAGNDLWAGRWTLLRNGERQRWELSGPTPEAVAAAAMDRLAEHYAEAFSVFAGAAQDKVLLEVSAVAALQGYARVQAYLSRLSAVKDVRLLGVDDDVLRFELDLNGSVHTLEQSIAVGRILEPMPKGEVVIPLGEPVANETPLPPEQDTAETSAPPLDFRDAMTETIPETPIPVLRYRYRG
ncbi:MAG: DUF2066 domain-containing protein [Proteobacteria bacterium]|nr:DUF2066 domain-containing protein [Pseudomonadota bacterium]